MGSTNNKIKFRFREDNKKQKIQKLLRLKWDKIYH
jgi:hypothetical protein